MPPTTWVITDTHFNHQIMCRVCGRPENFTELIVKNWAKRVEDGDIVIHLGDVIFSNASSLKAIMMHLPHTTNILVWGNHDEHSNSWYYEHGFHFVVDSFTQDGVYFTHVPAQSLPSGCRMNVCGHLHNNSYETIMYYDPMEFYSWHRVLALEDMKYSPRPLQEIIDGKWHRRDLLQYCNE